MREVKTNYFQGKASKGYLPVTIALIFAKPWPPVFKFVIFNKDEK